MLAVVFTQDKDLDLGSDYFLCGELNIHTFLWYGEISIGVMMCWKVAWYNWYLWTLEHEQAEVFVSQISFAMVICGCLFFSNSPCFFTVYDPGYNIGWSIYFFSTLYFFASKYKFPCYLWGSCRELKCYFKNGISFHTINYFSFVLMRSSSCITKSRINNNKVVSLIFSQIKKPSNILTLNNTTSLRQIMLITCSLKQFSTTRYPH